MGTTADRKKAVPGCGLALALLALLVCGDPGPCQQASTNRKNAARPAAKAASLPSIEEMLATALKYNSDIRVAEVKLRDDEAELSRTRLRVMQRVIALHHSLQSFQAAVDSAQAKYKRLSELVNRGTMQPAVLREAEQELAQTRARYSEAEAEVPYLLGKGPGNLAREVLRTEVQIGGTRRSPASTIRPAMARKIRKALDTEIKADYQGVPLTDVLKDLREKTRGVAFQRNLALKDLDEIKITMRLGEVPLGAVLLALQDTLPGMRILVRDYGLLVSWEHQVPLGAVRVYDFWKSDADDKAGR